MPPEDDPRRDPDAPAPGPPPGCVVGPATWDDLADVRDLYRRCEVDRIGTATTRSEDVRTRWLDTDLHDVVLVRDRGGDLVACAELHADTDPWTDTADVFVEGRVDPACTGRGLATFLLGGAEDRARREAAGTPAGRAVLRTTVVDGDDRARAFFTRRGFRPVRHFLEMRLGLVTAPAPPAWPSGVTGRPMRPGEVAAVWRVHQRAFADLPTHLPLDLGDWRADRIGRDPHHDPGLWFVAETADGIVGVCLARPATPEGAELGWIRDLGVVPAWRRRGVGLALLRAAFAAFRDRGLTGAALEVDDVTLDGAAALYRAAGMQVVRRTDVLARRIPAG